MKRFAPLLLAVLCAFPLLAAAPSIIAEPTVMLFPFQVGGDADRAAGSRIALIIANRLAELHNVHVKAAPSGTERAHYLQTARDAGADYYVAGYVTPLGDEVSLVEQVVSTLSGIVVYSGTAQLRTYGESLAQGELIDTAIIHHAMRDIGNYQASTNTQANAVPTPIPSASAAQQADIGRLFRSRRPRANASPSPSPSPQSAPIASASKSALPPVPARPGKGAPSPVSAPPVSLPTVPPGTTGSTPVAVALNRGTGPVAIGAIGGVGAAANRFYAEDRLRHDLARRTSIVALATDPTQICAAGRAGAIASGLLATAMIGQSPQATFELTVARCDGRSAFRRTFVRTVSPQDGIQRAIAQATDAAAAAYLASR